MLRGGIKAIGPASTSGSAERLVWVWTGVLLGAAGLGAQAAGPLAWDQHEGYRSAALAVPAGGKTGFTLMPREKTGIWFTNQLSYDTSRLNQNLLNGAGLAGGDVDG